MTSRPGNRVRERRYPSGTATHTDRIAAAEQLNLGGAEFVDPFQPAEWLGDRGGALGGPRF